ncbi:hypothetical protein ADEAN_000270600 [Angomonas deanei]|uniref:Uncharacterized protein n=1 Tax=Angomonas deanei TaxID=59799 RepID=A0A7G2C889_9TRYP|nr:hypothetical protein ADEAN_000270600 [Angomonas deanei]
MVDRLEESGEENLLSAAAAQRITELEKNVEDMEAEFNELRRDYSQCKMDLQLAEKRLTFRQERIEFLKASLQNESQKSVDLSQTLEREREGQRGLLQKARNDASYYRKRYEDLQRKMQNQAPKSRAGSYVENTHHEADDDELDSQLSIECSSPGFNLFKSILGGRK